MVTTAKEENIQMKPKAKVGPVSFSLGLVSGAHGSGKRGLRQVPRSAQRPL